MIQAVGRIERSETHRSTAGVTVPQGAPYNDCRAFCRLPRSKLEEAAR